MVNETVAAIIAVIGTLAGAWWGGVISSKAADRVMTRQAYARLAAAFAEELVLLKTTTDAEIGYSFKLLQSSYRKHLVVYIELRASLCGDERSSIEEKWNLYTQEAQNLCPSEREKYRFSYLLKEGVSEEERQLLASKHIETLIQFDSVR